MGDIVKEMGDQAPNRFFRFRIMLPANVAKAAMQLCVAIKTYFLLAFLGMRQCKIFPKIMKPLDFRPANPV
jgi:hypothetical protein